MFDVKLMRRAGARLSQEEAADVTTYTGDFVLDAANGARRLRIRNPWSGSFAPVELYDPVLVAAQGGSLRWRGFERVGEQGLVQEWFARTKR